MANIIKIKMGTLITTESLKQVNACPGAIEFFTGSFCVSGNEFYSSGGYSKGGIGSSGIGSGFVIENYKKIISPECYFEDNIIYPFSCSNSKEVSDLMWAADAFKITGSFYNKELDSSQFYYYVPMVSKGYKNPRVIGINYTVR